jgi:hypothetical protein
MNGGRIESGQFGAAHLRNSLIGRQMKNRHFLGCSDGQIVVDAQKLF